MEDQELELPLDIHGFIKLFFEKTNKPGFKNFIKLFLDTKTNEFNIEFLADFLEDARWAIVGQHSKMTGDWESMTFYKNNDIIYCYEDCTGWDQDENGEKTNDTACHSISFEVDLNNRKINNFHYSVEIYPGEK
jgi:hypothetical protein